MRLPAIMILMFFYLNGSAQSSTDCPTWGKKNKTSKADYFKYLSKNQGKKAVAVIPEQPAPAPVPAKTKQYTSTGSKTTGDYTTRRYNLIPKEENNIVEESNEQEIIVSESEVLPDKEEPVLVKEENAGQKTVVPEEPAIEEVQKSSAIEVAKDDSGQSEEKIVHSKVHKKKKKLFNKEIKRNAVKKTPRLGKRRIDRCATRF